MAYGVVTSKGSGVLRVRSPAGSSGSSSSSGAVVAQKYPVPEGAEVQYYPSGAARSIIQRSGSNYTEVILNEEGVPVSSGTYTTKLHKGDRYTLPVRTARYDEYGRLVEETFYNIDGKISSVSKVRKFDPVTREIIGKKRYDDVAVPQDKPQESIPSSLDAEPGTLTKTSALTGVKYSSAFEREAATAIRRETGFEPERNVAPLPSEKSFKSSLDMGAGTLSSRSALTGSLYGSVSQRKEGAGRRRVTGFEFGEKPSSDVAVAYDEFGRPIDYGESFGFLDVRATRKLYPLFDRPANITASEDWRAREWEVGPMDLGAFDKFGYTPAYFLQKKEQKVFKVSEYQPSYDLGIRADRDYDVRTVGLSPGVASRAVVSDAFLEGLKTEAKSGLRSGVRTLYEGFIFPVVRGSGQIVSFPLTKTWDIAEKKSPALWSQTVNLSSKVGFNIEKFRSDLRPRTRDVVTAGITIGTAGVGAVAGSAGIILAEAVGIGFGGYNLYSGGKKLVTGVGRFGKGEIGSVVGETVVGVAPAIPGTLNLAVSAKTAVFNIGKTRLALEPYVEPEVLAWARGEKGGRSIPFRSGTPKELVAEVKSGKWAISDSIKVKGFERTYVPKEYVDVRYEFKVGKSGTEYVEPFERLGVGAWHTSPGPLKGRVTGAGSSATPGLYLSPSESIYFLKLKAATRNYSYSFWGRPSSPTAQYMIPVDFKELPPGFVESASARLGRPNLPMGWGSGKIGAGGIKGLKVNLSKAQRKAAVIELNKFFNRVYNANPKDYVSVEAMERWGTGAYGSGTAFVSPEYYLGKGEPEFIVPEGSRFYRTQLGEKWNWWDKFTGYKYTQKVPGGILDVPVKTYKFTNPRKISRLPSSVKERIGFDTAKAEAEFLSSERYYKEISVPVASYANILPSRRMAPVRSSEYAFVSRRNFFSEYRFNERESINRNVFREYVERPSKSRRSIYNYPRRSIFSFPERGFPSRGRRQTFSLVPTNVPIIVPSPEFRIRSRVRSRRRRGEFFELYEWFIPSLI